MTCKHIQTAAHCSIVQLNVLCSIPLVMFVVWNGAILGSLDTGAAGGKMDPLLLLTQRSPSVGILIQVHAS